MDEQLKREVDRYNFMVEDAKRHFGEWDYCDPVVWAILRVVQAQNDLSHAIDEVACLRRTVAHDQSGHR